ncbi:MULTISPECIES: DUF2975 domain-containing protein [Legionella]|uniref:DUF2975 domain-containing protein n=1 Tax=Legionella septentrionalis TaxID=2498109 RepID=A0A433JK72_9GAMM|nr:MULTISPECIES: DUF2975 domain-containing protein [Legionella]MCP0914910.1 DUF2975 domain-containing protein [Legionella sp. 27cVA30]RUQ88859.1 DUF2975 domain-containing protein [Legionella septentrionalis]RUR02971.1 DUF2975 domain-containing protein [Legionella septentrionalis]RUR11570.1 DUF2975 domain-containing protein [Legionella septentrionalis]RUR16836.1 DUF2975 domain-containing protein [Legionella septentrionalis]
MKKIQRTSRLLRLFFTFICWAIPLTSAYFILFHLERIIEWGAWSPMISSKHIQGTSHYSLIHRFIILMIQLLPLSITVLICNKLAKLFGLYERGELFEEENIKLIRAIGIYMILGELVQLIYQPMLTAALSFNNQTGERVISVTLGTTNIATLLTACIILVASWIIKEANQLKTDSQLTI